MVIAISFFTDAEPKENTNFIFEISQRISKSYLEHTFVFISNEPFPDLSVFSENVIPVEINYDAKSPMKWLIWQNIKIPKVLKKYKANVFISERFCSLPTKVPQILISPDLSFIHQPSFYTKRERFFYKKFAPRFLKKAKAIIGFSEFEKADVIKQYKIASGKTEVIYEGVNENFEPVNFEEREIIKEKYTDGNEYFIYAGIISPQKNLMNLLKAFSVFKKRQRSNMQLIFAGKPGKQFEEFKGSLDSYKFKKEIKLLNGLSQPEIRKVMASSYAMVFPSVYEISASELLTAMKSEVPVIASSKGAMPEIFGDAVSYFNPENFKDIAEKMMLIFKDEILRKELIKKGQAQIKKYDWDKSALLVWNIILRAMNQNPGTHPSV